MTIYAWIVLRQMEWLNIGCVVFLVVMGLLLLRLCPVPPRGSENHYQRLRGYT